MKQIGLLISRYLVSTIFPYFVFAWLLLSVILFVQQASRYSDIFFSVNIPTNLIWQLTIALIPNVIAFTCPMAMLVGTIIGLTKMQGDSELVAIRASGVGTLQIAFPIMLLGLLLSIFAFFVNLEGVPLAATLVRNVALETAIKKLESPIEPGVFNSEVAGYTIYVKGGDFETGRWKNIFIYREDRPNGNVRLITSKQGRIDTSDQLSELVLENAVVTTMPIGPGQGKYVSENIGEVRLAIQTKRSDLIKKLSGSQVSPEELGLSQLSDYAAAADGKERVEAQILWQRRIILSITPLIFCLLGTVIVLRFNRGGRGFGAALALAVLIGFYLLAFLGEQLARTGRISVIQASLLPMLGSLAAVLWFNYSKKINFWSGWGRLVSDKVKRVSEWQNRVQTTSLFVDLMTGLRDFDIVRNLLKNFILTLVFLSAIFVIFTAFELWKFAGTFDGGVVLLAKYLFYLLPFVYLQVAPSAAMIGTLATYVIKSRQNEIITWTSAGLSVYRLLLPCFLLMLVIGGLDWAVQERLLPHANQLQDTTRNLIRNRGVSEVSGGKYWVANEKRIYSFELDSLPTGNKMIGPGIGLSKRENPVRASDNAVEALSNWYGQPYYRVTNKADTVTGIAASDNEKGRWIFNHLKANPLSSEKYTSQDLSNEQTGVAAASDNEIRLGRHERAADTTSLNFANVIFRIGWADRTLGTMPLGFFDPVIALISTTNEKTESRHPAASDNANQNGLCLANCVRNLTVYQFADNGEILQAVYRTGLASWDGGQIVFKGTVEKNSFVDGKIITTEQDGGHIEDAVNPFQNLRSKPNHLNSSELKSQILSADSELESRNYSVALEKKYTTILLPFVMALFTAPFSLSLSRKGKAATVGYAIGLWLLFTGTSSVFEQLGLNGMLAPALAIWSPLFLFSLLGIYLLSKIRT